MLKTPVFGYTVKDQLSIIEDSLLTLDELHLFVYKNVNFGEGEVEGFKLQELSQHSSQLNSIKIAH